MLPDLCNADGQLIVCVANTSRIIVAMLVAISFILYLIILEIKIKNNNLIF